MTADGGVPHFYLVRFLRYPVVPTCSHHEAVKLLLLRRWARQTVHAAKRTEPGVQERRSSMRFALLYRSGRPESNEPPSPREMEAVGNLMQEMSQAGVLLGAEGFEPSATGARIRIDSGKFAVNNGPFADTNDHLDGYALVKVKTKAEAIEWSKRFLTAVGEGESEIRQLREMP